MDPYTDNVDTASCSTANETPPRHLCKHGCGFFGTADNMGLCSKCYKDYAQLHTDFETRLQLSDPPVGVEAPAPARRRCGSCNKKLGLLWFVCRCEGSFCGKHRHPESHGCGFDFKKDGKIAIQRENPLCKPDKIEHRI